MRALVVLAHYFKAEPHAPYSSTDDRRREARRRSVMASLAAWRAHFGETATLNVEHRKFEINAPALETLDLVVVVSGDDHLLDDAELARLGVRKIAFALDQPRLLPFLAHRVLADRQADYDWLVYAEEDLLLHDADLFQKLAAFQASFGPRRVLQPHRYEINPHALRPKTYIDGDLRPGLVRRLFAFQPETENLLVQRGEGGGVKFVRAQNPHSGFFALSAEQFRMWSAQPHFLDMDCSFVSPLESAATLGLVKTFSVFKPATPLHHLEIEHCDQKFSSFDLPVLLRGEFSPA